jgi:hypothetical protein
MEDDKIDFTKEGTNSIKLSKMSKGYNWEIKIYENDLNKNLALINSINDQLKDKYGKLDDGFEK